MLISLCYRPNEVSFAISSRLKRDLTRAPPEATIVGTDKAQAIPVYDARAPGAADRCDILIVVMDENWHSNAPFQHDDPVREAIEAAIGRDTRVIPLLIGDTQLPNAQQLPVSIRGIVDYEAHRLRAGGEYAATRKQRTRAPRRRA